MESLIERIKNLLATKDVTAEITDDGELIFLARTGPISVRIRITARKEALIVRAHIPLFVPPHRRQAMCETIALANWELRAARFQLDATDGELICCADFLLFDGVPTDEQLTRLIFAVWSITERYAAALVDVMTGQTEPSVAIARAEQPKAPQNRRTQVPDLTVN